MKWVAQVESAFPFDSTEMDWRRALLPKRTRSSKKKGENIGVASALFEEEMQVLNAPRRGRWCGQGWPCLNREIRDSGELCFGCDYYSKTLEFDISNGISDPR